MLIERIPLLLTIITFCMVLSLIGTIYYQKHMKQIPYISILVFFMMAGLNIIYSRHKKIPHTQWYFNMIAACILLVTKLYYNEKNMILPMATDCEQKRKRT